MAIKWLTCFHSISVPIMPLNQILHMRLGSWCRRRHIRVLRTGNLTVGQGFGSADCSDSYWFSPFHVALLLCRSCFKLIMLDSETSLSDAPASRCIPVTLHPQMIHVSVPLYVVPTAPLQMSLSFLTLSHWLLFFLLLL